MRASHTDQFSGQGSTVHEQLLSAQIIHPTRKKGRLFGLFPLNYIFGSVIGVTYPLWIDEQIKPYLSLFFKALLDEVFPVKAAAQTLSWHLSVQIIFIAIFLFMGCAVFGAPVLILCIICKGAINGAIYHCILTNMYSVSVSQFIRQYMLFELGSTGTLFAILWELSDTWRSLFLAYFTHKNSREIVRLRSDKLLSIILLNILWYIIIQLLTHPWNPAVV